MFTLGDDISEQTVQKEVIKMAKYRKWDVIKTHDNRWRVITKIKKVKGKTVYTGHPELLERGKIAKRGKKFGNNDVKWKIGDMRRDTVGIGKARHKREVVPMIRTAKKRFGRRKRR